MNISPPLEAELLVTPRCNMYCPHCCANASSTIGNNTDLDTSIWLDVVDQLVDMGVQAFTLTGGEPTLHAGLINLIKRINQAGRHSSITTNAFYIDDTYISELLSIGLDQSKVSFHISIDGPEAKHDTFRKAPGAFKKAIYAIKKLNSVGFSAQCNFMLTPDSIEWFDDLEKKLRAAGCTSINIGQCAPVGRNSIDLDYEKWSDFIRRTTKSQKIEKHKCSVRCMTHGIWQLYLPLLDDIEAVYSVWSKKSEVTDDCKSCPAGVFTIAIDGEGWVFPCDLMTSYKELRCGNILHNKVVDIWHSSSVLNDLRQVDYKKISPCSTCFMGELCHSGCRGATFGLTKSLMAPDIRCPMVGSYADKGYPKYNRPVVIRNDESKVTKPNNKVIESIKIFNSKIDLVVYNHSLIAKTKAGGNGFMIVNKFGYRILKMIASGFSYHELIEIFSDSNGLIKEKIKLDIKKFIMELIVHNMVSFRGAKDYIFLKEEIKTASQPKDVLVSKDILSPIIYYQIDSKYLVYISKLSHITLMNKMGLEVALLFASGLNTKQIVEQLHQNYKGCSKDDLKNDVLNFLIKSKLIEQSKEY